MTPATLLFTLLAYFTVLVVVAYITGKNTNSEGFFVANRNSAWYLVAFGMIGTSLSGVTFISVPGQVKANGFAYLQLVFGYLAGYAVIAFVLMPVYYRLNLVSIYSYLETRIGPWAYKSGAVLFLISRSIGSAARFFLVINTLQYAIFDHFQVPFPLTVLLALLLIWLYTYQGGIKTIIWTDTLQTLMLVSALIWSVFYLVGEMKFESGSIQAIAQSDYSNVFTWDWNSKNNFFKQFLSGAFIAIAMTGLDQDMMQKNLTCKNLGEAQKNVISFSLILLVINVLFLCLGVLLYLFAAQNNIELPGKPDAVFPLLALNHFAPVATLLFFLGIVAATYASTDSALTALTTSFCFDFLHFDKKSESTRQKQKWVVHITFTVVLLVIVLIIDHFHSDSLIFLIFKLAGYTYGPLLGLFGFSILTKRKTNDKYVPLFCLLSPTLTFLLQTNSEQWFNGYQMGFEILIINGLICFLLLLILSKKGKSQVLS